MVPRTEGGRPGRKLFKVVAIFVRIPRHCQDMALGQPIFEHCAHFAVFKHNA